MQSSVFVGTSLDGYIARRDGTFGFLPAEPEPHGYEEFMATVDALVIGRNTYEVVLPFPWGYGDKQVFVLSNHPLKPAPAGAAVERMSGDCAKIGLELDARGVKHAYVDGGLTIQQFLRAGLISRLIITRVPVLIGDGIQLFGSLPQDLPVKHVATRHFRSGLVQSEYHLPGCVLRPLW